MTTKPPMLVFLYNEPMRKRCQSMAITLQLPTSKVCLSTRLKCVTYVEKMSSSSNKSAFSFSEATDRLFANAHLVLCLLRVASVSPDACGLLSDMLAARHSHLSADRVMLVQCCGSDYAAQSVSKGIGCCLDSNPAVIDFCLRGWLASCLDCDQVDVAAISVENTTAGKALRHRLFGRRYTMQVEYCEQRVRNRRGSLYQLTEGREAENGGCSPAAVVKRRLSQGDAALSVPCKLIVEELNLQPEDADSSRQLFQLDSAAAWTASAGAPTLVVCASNSCSREAALCLNNLASQGHRAIKLEAFAANPKNVRPTSSTFSTTGLGVFSGGRLSRLLSRLSPSAAANMVLLLFCRGPQSGLLADFLAAASTAPADASLSAPVAALPRACFAVMIGPVSETECQDLHQRGRAVSSGCQVDVVCCLDGLRGSRVIDFLMPALTAFVRQLEVSKWLRRRQ